MASKRPKSNFDGLIHARHTSEHPDSQTSKQPQAESSAASGLAKSQDPDYLKFTTYIRKDTHKAVKLRAIDEGLEMSDLVQELLAEWLRRK